MTIEEALVKLLTEAAGVDPADEARAAACHRVNAIAGGRIFPVRAPQGTRQSHIVYHRISGPREYSQDGDSGLAHPRFQFDIWAPTFENVRDLADAVRVALSGYQGTIGQVRVDAIFLEDDDDDWDDDLKMYLYRQDWTVWHSE